MLKLIAVVWAQVAHLRLLILCQPNIFGRLCPLFVLPRAGKEVRNARHHRQRGEAKTDTVALLVVRCFLAQECEDGNDS